MLRLLHRRDFALLWWAGLISLAGDWVLLIGLPLYIYRLTGSTLATGGMLMAEVLPALLLGSVAGVFVDRWDRRQTMVIANLLLALCLLPLLLVHARDQIWIVYLVSALEATISQFFRPAEAALLPRLVGAEHVVQANALVTLNANLARLSGPAFGGIIAAAWGLPGIALVDATSFLLSAALLGAIAAPGRAARAELNAARAVKPWLAVWQEWIAGLRLVRRTPTVRALFVVTVIPMLGEGVFGTLFVVFVYRVLHGGTIQVGLLMSGQAVGGLLGGALVGAVGRRLPLPYLIGWCAIGFGLGDLAIFNAPRLTHALAVPLGLIALVGIVGVGYGSGINSILQTHVADEYRGRVLGTYGTTGALLGLIGIALAGFLGDRLGTVAILNVQGAGYVASGALALLLLRRAHISASAPRGGLDADRQPWRAESNCPACQAGIGAAQGDR
jgi:MFS family permease